MQELQSENNAASVEDGTWLREDIRVNVHHQVTAVGIFHDKTHVFLQQQANRIVAIASQKSLQLNQMHHTKVRTTQFARYQ